MKLIFKKTNKTNKAFTLVETLVAISIFSMSLLGLMSILASSISSTTYAKQKIVGAYLAQEGIEYLRNMRDTSVLYSVTGQIGWDSFKTKLASCVPGSECGFVKPVVPFNVSLCTALSQCKLYINNGGYDTVSSGTDSGFVRKVWMTTINANDVRIFSKVSWTQSSGTSNVSFSEDLFNWVE
ncbi:prepilin-type N-terminal cleavage/methylation domain-containing protein [Candidatus Nomurabacteria bacterium]|nr:prepilin-type N-terminal cleavage/methylation domain-containing protein [Candidatus Nomurabacteria bacterium]